MFVEQTPCLWSRLHVCGADSMSVLSSHCLATGHYMHKREGRPAVVACEWVVAREYPRSSYLFLNEICIIVVVKILYGYIYFVHCYLRGFLHL